MMESGPVVALLAEDDRNDVFFMERALEKSGLRWILKPLSDGEEVVRYLEGVGVYRNRAEHPLPSIVLLDIHMPRRSGLEVLEWARNHEGFGKIRFVVLSASCDTPDITQAMNLGAAYCLLKPPTAQKLAEMLKVLHLERPS